MNNKANRNHKIFGRPPFAEEKKRAVKVAVFLRQSELEQLLEKAEMSSISLPEILRRAALNKKIEPLKSIFDMDAVAELRAIGQNINQTARELSRARMHFKDVEYQHLETILQKQFQILNEIKNELIQSK